MISHPGKRPLLILIRQSNGTLKQVAQNDNAVYCVDCSGIIGDPYMNMIIKKVIFLFSTMEATRGDGEEL